MEAYKNKTVGRAGKQKGKGNMPGEMVGEEGVDHKGPFVLGLNLNNV